ncbi:hypothetical protein ACW9KT_02050 [Hymenobacter sp. HD11105]
MRAFLLIVVFFLLCVSLLFIIKRIIIKRNRSGEAVDLNAAH